MPRSMTSAASSSLLAQLLSVRPFSSAGGRVCRRYLPHRHLLHLAGQWSLGRHPRQTRCQSNQPDLAEAWDRPEAEPAEAWDREVELADRLQVVDSPEADQLLAQSVEGLG